MRRNSSVREEGGGAREMEVQRSPSLCMERAALLLNIKVLME